MFFIRIRTFFIRHACVNYILPISFVRETKIKFSLCLCCFAKLKIFVFVFVKTRNSSFFVFVFSKNVYKQNGSVQTKNLRKKS